MDRHEVNAFCLKWHWAAKEHSHIARKLGHRESYLVGRIPERNTTDVLDSITKFVQNINPWL
jgi:hypothetical protein